MRAASLIAGSRSLTAALFACVLITATSVNAIAASQSPAELVASGAVDKAVQILQQQITQSPKDAAAENLLCRAYYMMEEWDLAVATCERAVDLDPQSSNYSLWLGRVYGEKADHSAFITAPAVARRALASFERAVALDPKNVEARIDLGEFYAEAPAIIGGGHDKAYRQADALMPLSAPMAHWLLARIAEKEKDHAKAEREYRAEITVSNAGVRGWLDLANFYMYKHRYEEMEQALGQAETSPIDHPESLMHGANLLLRSRRDYPLGVLLIRRYLAGRPCEEGPAFKAHAILGELLEKQGDREAAAQQFRAALALFQNYPRAKDDLQRLAR